MLNRITIKNFRNLDYAEFELSKNNYFCGQNAIGKSNILEAIFWALTNHLLDNSKEVDSIKPKKNQKSEVCVELEFDNFVVKKTFKEKWVKTRGGTDYTFTGHETNTFINKILIPAQKTDDKIKELINLNYQTKTKINLLSAVLDPHYLAQKVDWKILRNFIVEIVGDVFEEDVYLLDQNLLKLKPLMKKNNVDDLKKVVGSDIKNLKSEIEVLDIKILTLSEEVDPVELEKIKKTLKNKLDELEQFNQQKKLSTQALTQELKNNKAEILNSLTSSQQNDLEIMKKNNQSVDNLIKKEKENKENLEKENKENNLKIKKLNSELDLVNQNLKILRNDLNNKNLEKKALIFNLDEELKKEFIPNKKMEDLICPHCGKSLNQEAIDKFINSENIRALKFAEDKKNTHKTTKEKVIKINQYLKENSEDELLEKIKEIELKISSENISEYLEFQLKNINLKIQKFNDDLQTNFISEETILFKEDLNKISLRIENIVIEKESDETKLNIENLKKEIESLKNEEILIFSKIENLKKAENYKVEQKTKIVLLAENEHILDLITLFIKLKLQLFDEKIEAVFGDVKFQLIEENIKEASWDEICYALDDNVSIKRTNEAKKLEIGIKIVEAIKNNFNVLDLPIIFDRGESITTQNLLKFKPNGQIISTKVEDENEKILLRKEE